MASDQPPNMPRISKRRLLKAHKKSRVGCGECKLRKVKCDEGKPACKRCQVGGHACKYGGNNALFELMMNDVARRKIVDNVSFCLQLPQASGLSVHSFSIQDVRLLDRFRSQTALTIATDRNRGIYQNQIVEMAPQYPFLMHTLLALTLMHDRYQRGLRQQSPSVQEAYHHYRSTVTFSARVKQPVQPGPSESAAIWVSAILTSLIAFGRIETNPEDVWPLGSSSLSDLSWLMVGEGKVHLTKMTHLLKTEAQYQGLFPPQAAAIIPKRSTAKELQTLSQELLRLCDLDTIANEDNPYHAVAATYAKSMDKDFASTLVLFFCLIGNIPSSYKDLLCQKDPRALLLLALWYATLSSIDIWWLQPRPKLEGHAICIYLRRYYSHNLDLQYVMTSVWRGLNERKLAVQQKESLVSQG